MAACRITKATQGSAVFETVSEEQLSGRVLERMTPPRGYSAVSASGLLTYELDGNKHQIPFGFGDLQVPFFLFFFFLRRKIIVTTHLPCPLVKDFGDFSDLQYFFF